MRVIECDVCGRRVRRTEAIRIDVDVPTRKDDESVGWSDLDICLRCVERKKMGAVLASAAEGFQEALDKIRDDPKVAGAPS